MLTKILHKTFGGSASTVFKGMATLALGSGVAKLIGIAAIPLLARLYSPEDFGVLSVFTALIVMIAPLVTLRYPLAIPLPRHDGTAFTLMVASIGCMLISTLIVSSLLWGLGGPLLTPFSMEVLAPYWWLISLGILGAASYELLSLWATRQRHYKIIAKTQVWQSSCGALVKVIFGLLAVKPLGLLLGQVVAQAGGISSLLREFFSDFKKQWPKLRWSRMRIAVWRYRNIPIYRVPSQFLLVFSQQSPLLFIAWQYNSAVVGQFSLALMALTMPLNLLGHSMGKALMAEAAKLGKNKAKEIYIMTKKVQLRLLLFSIIPVLILFIAGEMLFSWVFGEEWGVAGKFASILSIYMLFQFTSAPLMQLVNVIEKQALLFWLNLGRLIVLCFIFIIAHDVGLDEYAFLLAYSSFNSTFYLLVTIVILVVVRRAAKQQGGNL